MATRTAIVVVSILFFVCGAFEAVLSNIIFNTNSLDLHNRRRPFRRPWFMDWSMFVGMSIAIFRTPEVAHCECPKYVVGDKLRGWGLFRVVSIPALCDLFGTCLSNLALLSLKPSVWQIMRGSILLFTALLSVFYRHKRLKIVDWLGVIVTVIGIVIVGVSSILSERNSAGPSHSVGLQVLSMFFILLSMGLQALQTVIEEELLQDIDATDAEVVAYEGLWGLYFATLVFLPLASILPENGGEGIYENWYDSWVMFARSPTIIGLWIGYVCATCGFNQSGMLVTAYTNAVNRTIYEALRTMAVWALSVIVYYLPLKCGGGEPLTLLSLLEVAGFIVSIVGSFIYHRVIKIPGLDDGDAVEETPISVETPLMSVPDREYQ
jgi:drug/metabolite transporter (DMT)-like permease